MPRDLRQRTNRELYRTVNERIVEVATGFEVPAKTQGFICECSLLGCHDLIEVPLDVYARVLATPSAYLVGAGHEDSAVEDVAEATEGYRIVVERHD